MKSIRNRRSRAVRIGAASVLALAASAALAAPALAHAFGSRYDLPLPLNLYLIAAGAAVAASFVILAMVFTSDPPDTERAKYDLLRLGFFRALVHPFVTGLFELLSVLLFFLIVAAGLYGNQDTVRNIEPTIVWIIWWVGLAYVAALVGNIWPVLNPWSALHRQAGRGLRSIGLPEDLGLPYPKRLGAWPAIILFMAFAWFELISESAKEPAVLAEAILVYSAITLAGMFLFGRRVWLENGEAFSLAFNVFGRFAPIGAPERDPGTGKATAWYIRPFAGNLVGARAERFPLTIFIIVMLSTVTFDGFKETPVWGDLLQWFPSQTWFHPVLRLLHDMGFDFHVVLETVVLILFPVVFLLVYLLFCWLTKLFAGGVRSTREIAGIFVYTLVPIAIAYHLAHYLSYLLIAGQYSIPLLSDPFGWGWDLFGTADYQIDIGVIGAKFVWYTAVLAIVIGHVIAIGVAHLVALRVFETGKAALKSQYPFLVLMVGYTMVSLWILSQPIVGSPSLSMLAAPSGSHVLAPFEFRERCLDMEVGETATYSFRTDRPVDFDIHHHDGFITRFELVRPDTTEGGGEFVAPFAREYCFIWMNQGLQDSVLDYAVERQGTDH